MKGKTHAGAGIVVYVALADKIGGVTLSGILVVLVASLLPDIDHPKSLINRYILPIKNKKTKTLIYVLSGAIVLWFDYNMVKEPALKALGVTLMIVGVSSHRNGLTHSFLGMLIFCFIATFLGDVYKFYYWPLYVSIGYGMHLIGDMMTNRGVPMFYPFYKKNIKFPITYKTDSKIGNFFEVLIMIFGLVYIFFKLIWKRGL